MEYTRHGIRALIGARLYLDTEFNGFGGFLISLALVSTEGREWYEVRARSEFGPIIDPWVQANVIPKLGKQAILQREFRESLHVFLLQFNNPEIICDWHDDAMHFCSLLNGPDFGSSLDYACRITILRTPPGQPISSNPHNALADARSLAEWHTRKLAA